MLLSTETVKVARKSNALIPNQFGRIHFFTFAAWRSWPISARIKLPTNVNVTGSDSSLNAKPAMHSYPFSLLYSIGPMYFHGIAIRRRVLFF